MVATVQMFHTRLLENSALFPWRSPASERQHGQTEPETGQPRKDGILRRSIESHVTQRTYNKFPSKQEGQDSIAHAKRCSRVANRPRISFHIRWRNTTDPL